MKVFRVIDVFLILILPLFGSTVLAQQVTGQDIDKILERADKLLDEAKTGYEEAHTKGSVLTFIDAGFKLEEARIKYLVLQEIGSADKQKIAADRLRAVNQLNKLIHDGKVAVGGTPAEPASAKPADPAPAGNPPPGPPGPPVKAAADVSKRAPVPDVVKQRKAEKLAKDLFKDQYAQKAPADRKALARLLLEQAAKSQEDPVAVWVLCREAQDMAVQSCDVGTALEAIEAAARVFDVDAMSMKYTALTAAAKTAKAPEEFALLSEALQQLIDELVRADQFDSADKAAASALQCARGSKDSDLLGRVTVRAKEVAEAKTLYQSMKSVMETQAKNPDDPGANLEIGRFLCFVKGSWDLGLRFMVKGSDPALKALAGKELAFPLPAADRAALADGWYDLAEKEKSPLRRSQLLGHAKAVYESALPDAVALVRAKIEKRLKELETSGARTGAATAPIDLLKRVDFAKDSIKGTWQRGGKGLVSPLDACARIHLPYAPPDEYDLLVTVARKDKTDSTDAGGFYIGLVRQDKHFGVEIDSGCRRSMIHLMGGQQESAPGAYVRGSWLGDGRSHRIVYRLRKNRVEVRIDDKSVLDWSADFSKVWVAPEWSPRDPRLLLVGSCLAAFEIKQMTLVPISGTGKPAR